MALDANILLRQKQPQIDLQAAARAPFQALAATNEIKQMPIRNQLLQQRAQLAEQANEDAIRQAQLGEMTLAFRSMKPFIDQGDIAGASNVLGALGISEELTEDIQQELQDTPENVQTKFNSALNALTAQSGVSTKAFAPITDPETGQISIPTFDPKTGTTKLIPVEGAIKETPSQKRAGEVTVAGEKEKLGRRTKAIGLAIKKGGDVFDRLAPVSQSIANYDEAIAAIDEGAETGIVQNFLPSVRESSIKLDNIKKRLGLDVVGNTTFGALSEKELEFALDSALPSKLNPAALKEWLMAKRNAQLKVKERLEQAAQFLSSGDNTVEDWIQYDKARQFSRENQERQKVNSVTTQQQQAQQPSQSDVFEINGVTIRRIK